MMEKLEKLWKTVRHVIVLNYSCEYIVTVCVYVHLCGYSCVLVHIVMCVVLASLCMQCICGFR